MKSNFTESVIIEYGGRKYTLWGWGEKDNVFLYLKNTGMFYEIEILDFIKRKKIKQGIYVDVGAHIGNHTIFFANECRSTEVYAFEAYEKTFEFLQQNCKFNVDDAQKYKLFNVAITTEKEVFVRPDQNFDMGQTEITHNAGPDIIKINSVGLDDVLRNVQNIVFLKIDAEGSELKVLKSAIKILTTLKPAILIESKLDKFDEVNKFLINLNYYVTKTFKSDPYLYFYEYGIHWSSFIWRLAKIHAKNINFFKKVLYYTLHPSKIGSMVKRKFKCFVSIFLKNSKN